MNTRNIILVVLMGLSLIGCGTSEKYAANNADGQRWLDEHRSSAGISVGGIWQSEEWGGSKLVQDGRTVNGTLGNYSVRGVVSGQRAYLLLSSNGWIFYTAVLAKPTATQLSGFYSYTVPFSLADQRQLELRRINE